MAVSRCTVSFGPYTDALGAVAFAGLRGRIRPTRPVIEIATGAVIVPEWIDVTIGSDGTATVSLAHTDQNGITPAGFSYEVTWGGRIGDPSPGDKEFALPVAAGATADFDLLGPSVVDPVVVPIAVGPQGLQGPQGIQGIQGPVGPVGPPTVISAGAVATGAPGTNAAASVTGPAGNQTLNLTVPRGDVGPRGLTPRGTWAAGTTYAVDDVVTFGGSMFRVINAHTSGSTQPTPAAPGVNLESWVEKGSRGDPGDLTPQSSNDTATGVLSLNTATYTAPLTRGLTLAGNVTLSNTPPSPGAGKSATVTFVIKQAATGGPYTVTWPTLEWAGDAAAPVMPTAPSSELMVHLFWTGVVWRGIVGGTFFP